MRIAVTADELTGVAESLPDELRRRGHEPVLHGACSEAEQHAVGSSQARRRPVTRVRGARSRLWLPAGPELVRRSRPTRSRVSAPHCVRMRRPPTAHAGGIKPDPSALADYLLAGAARVGAETRYA